MTDGLTFNDSFDRGKAGPQWAISGSLPRMKDTPQSYVFRKSGKVAGEQVTSYGGVRQRRCGRS